MDNSMKNRNIGWGQWIICCTSVYDERTTRYCTMYTGRGADYTMNCIEETESFNYYLYYYTVVTQTGRMKWFFGFSFKYSKVRREAAWPSMDENYCFRTFFLSTVVVVVAVSFFYPLQSQSILLLNVRADVYRVLWLYDLCRNAA